MRGVRGRVKWTGTVIPVLGKQTTQTSADGKNTIVTTDLNGDGLIDMRVNSDIVVNAANDNHRYPEKKVA